MPGFPDLPSQLPLLSRSSFFSPFEARRGQQALDEKKPGEAITATSHARIALDPRDLTGTYNLGTAQSR